jgi:hypothetical protein
MATIGRKHRIVLGVLAVLLLAYAAFGFFGVPRLLRAAAISFVKETYGRDLALGAVRFNPFTLVLEVHDAAFPENDGRQLLGFRRLLVNLDLSSILGRASIERIECDAPYTHLRIADDGSVNLAELAKPFENNEPEPKKTAEPMALSIGLLVVRDGRVELEDHTPSAPFTLRLAPISFDLANFATRGTAGNAFELHARSNADERFDLAGNFGLSPFAAKGTFGVTNLELATPRAYLADLLPFDLGSGVVTLSGSYSVAARPQLEIAAAIQKLRVAELGLRAHGAAADDVHLSSVAVDDARLDLAKHAVSVAKIGIAGGTVLAQLGADGRLNLAALAGPRVAPAEEPPAASAASPERAPSPERATPPAGTAAAEGEPEPAAPAWSISLADIEVTGVGVNVEDRQFDPGATFALAPLNLRVSNYRNAPDAEVDLHVDAGIDGRGRFSVDGKARPAEASFAGRLTLADFDLASLQPYVARNTQMSLLKGTFATQLDLARTADGVLTIRGAADVASLRTVDDALRQDFVKWDLLRATGIDYRSPAGRNRGHLNVKTLFAQAPYARVIIAPDQTVNVKQVLTPAAGAQGGAEETPAAASRTLGPTDAPLPMSIGTVRVAGGSANFADYWIQPNYAVSLVGLDGTITGLDSKPGSRAKVQIEGNVDKYAPAKITGEMNILSQSAYSDITVSLKGVELSTVTPYSGRFAGYKIEKGKLSVDVNYLVENRQLVAGQHFVVDQLQLGERVDSPDAVHLPLKLAVALMKDRNGVIDIDLPMTGSLDDPQFRLGPLIWKAFVGLLTKVATSPFAWLGRLGAGDPEMNVIEFLPGDSAIEPAGVERLGAVAKALGERPGLSLDVPLAYRADLDGPALAKKLLDARLQLAADKQPPRKGAAAGVGAAEDPARRFDLLIAQFRAELPRGTPLPEPAATLGETRRKDTDTESYVAANAALEAALLANRPATELDLDALGAARGRAIQDVLLGGGGLDPARVFLVRANDVKADGGKVRAELALKQ